MTKVDGRRRRKSAGRGGLDERVFDEVRIADGGVGEGDLFGGWVNLRLKRGRFQPLGEVSQDADRPADELIVVTVPAGRGFEADLGGLKGGALLDLRGSQE